MSGSGEGFGRGHDYEVSVSDFPDRRFTRPVSAGGGVQPRWRADGRELYFLRPDRQLMAVSVTSGAPPVFGEPVALFDARTRDAFRAALGMRTQYAVAPDGQRFLLNLEQSAESTRFMVLLNWQRLVEQAGKSRD